MAASAIINMLLIAIVVLRIGMLDVMLVHIHLHRRRGSLRQMQAGTGHSGICQEYGQEQHDKKAIEAHRRKISQLAQPA
ncbi:hypothetical protein LG202_04990 [Methylobacillus methanolivorans]